ncbi:MAG: hypothetical protein QNJ46_17335 [Leptolyngbyaceae cyanobacterium MO_188.B28]|nr:hypothetical protein [Leptolyngbyaceae cyanobacterium MO_188.B28]
MAGLKLRAQQGDPQAIAALLQTAFPIQPIGVKARLDHNRLILHLQSLDVLAQAPTLTFLEKWFSQLNPSGINDVQIQAQRQGQSPLSWESSLSLAQPTNFLADPPITTPNTVPLSQSAPDNETPNAPTDEPTPENNNLLTVDELAPYYQQLNLEPGVTIDAIDQAYFKLKAQARRQGESERLATLKEAYHILNTQLQLRTHLSTEEERQQKQPTAQLASLLQQRGLTAQISLRDRQLHIGLSASQCPKPRQPVAKIYTLLETLNLRDLRLDGIETVFVYGLSAPKQAVWRQQFPMPKPGFSEEDTDLLSFQNRYSSAIIFPALSILAIALNLAPITKFLLRGVKIWFHEFGHATIAWLSGRRAIPLPLGWTNFDPNRSLFVYVSILLLFGGLFWAGRRENRRWPMVLAIILALSQFWMTWLNSPRTFNILFSFGGIGGEFYLCGFLMVSFFFSLPDYFRWDFYRFPVVLGAAFTFWDNLWFWRQIDRGQASIPWGSLWGGSNDAGGDMNRLIQYGWSSQQIIDTYNLLGGFCLVAIIGVYFYFAFKQNRTVFFALLQRLNAC